MNYSERTVVLRSAPSFHFAPAMSCRAGPVPPSGPDGGQDDEMDSHDWVRKNRPAQLADEFDETIHSDESASENAEVKLLSRAQSERVREALEALPLAFKEILVLREIEGLSYKEISEVTGVAMGTVMSSLSRARRRLRDQLGTAPGREA